MPKLLLGIGRCLILLQVLRRLLLLLRLLVLLLLSLILLILLALVSVQLLGSRASGTAELEQIQQIGSAIRVGGHAATTTTSATAIDGRRWSRR